MQRAGGSGLAVLSPPQGRQIYESIVGAGLVICMLLRHTLQSIVGLSIMSECAEADFICQKWKPSSCVTTLFQSDGAEPTLHPIWGFSPIVAKPPSEANQNSESRYTIAATWSHACLVSDG